MSDRHFIVNKMLQIFIVSFSFTLIEATIDLNSGELQYLADHLTLEECRRLIAAAHFKNYDEPIALDQAERKVSKDLSCLDHLYHWNSQEGEGKGQTHDILEHRLRQLGRDDLADWLGKAVFHQLGVDLKNGIEENLNNFATSTPIEDENESMITLEPLIPKIEDPRSYDVLDYFFYSLAVGLSLTVVGLCFKVLWSSVRAKIKKKLSSNRLG
ncbi:hypothetical protein ABEB36_009946 [Hypothenemus hampei]|uniref:Death domain-containing protein n=1 Tax=Hypothenemus hampei TaxID=57062 RepID=A0ABD1EI00_HYPHA